MNEAILLLLLVSFGPMGVSGAEPPQKTAAQATAAQAKALVMASLTAEQRRLPKLGLVPYADSNFSRFLFFTVTWEGLPEGSVVVGNYAVDPQTGDVFSAVASCHEEDNQRLRTLQAQVRATLHLSTSGYKPLKTRGPLCDE
jgi:hypothetical protein